MKDIVKVYTNNQDRNEIKDIVEKTLQIIDENNDILTEKEIINNSISTNRRNSEIIFSSIKWLTTFIPALILIPLTTFIPFFNVLSFNLKIIILSINSFISSAISYEIYDKIDKKLKSKTTTIIANLLNNKNYKKNAELLALIKKNRKIAFQNLKEIKEQLSIYYNKLEEENYQYVKKNEMLLLLDLIEKLEDNLTDFENRINKNRETDDNWIKFFKSLKLKIKSLPENNPGAKSVSKIKNINNDIQYYDEIKSKTK